MPDIFGYASIESTSRLVNVVVRKDRTDPNFLEKAVGRMMYTLETVEGQEYLSIGTITEVITKNINMNEARLRNLMSSNGPMKDSDANDVRETSFYTQAVFKKNAEGKWEKFSPHLPTSISTGAPIYHLDDSIVADLVDGEVFPSVGYFRGMPEVPQPLDIPDFGGSRGAYHSGVIGRSGSGKTYLSSMNLASSMKHEEHAVLVIDPQGQWANENGMGFSVQKFARGLGRNVSVVRISEDVQLPWDSELFARMVAKLNVWKKGFRRMGAENLEAFSEAVTTRIMNKGSDVMDRDARELLEEVFAAIAKSESTLSRIYASEDKREGLRLELNTLAGIPYVNEEGVAEILDNDTLQDIEASWENILLYFSPLQNLFSSKNMSGGRRTPLGGENGFLSEVFQVRNSKSEPAPYLILDMSPSIALHAKSSLLQGKDAGLSMQRVLDDSDIKALILMSVLSEMKRAAEVAFATTAGNLNTQIVFDEAWRFAPEHSPSREISELSTMLEGFALDTRKFGIGWTYILQSPGDLRSGIWRQLSYVYSGWGLVGADVQRLEALSDDKAQVGLYRSFISPASTGVYPFMIMGSISPVIFTAVPTFINAYNSPEEYLEHNELWVNGITMKRGLPKVTPASVTPDRSDGSAVKKASTPETSYNVGGTSSSSEPQSVRKPRPEPETPIDDEDDELSGMPF